MRKDEQKGMRPGWHYRRGDVYLVNLNQAKQGERGNIQGGIRPAVVVSNNAANHFSNVLTVIPITSELKKTNLPTHYIFKRNRCFDVTSMALGEQTTPINKSAVIKYLGKVSEEEMSSVDDIIRAHFHLQPEDPIFPGEIFP